jgi:arylsulfatase A-like enzyme
MGPNLLFIYTDEQAVGTLATYGNERIHMPNLNRLAQESVVFDRAYVTQPVCTPSRSTLLTGLYPHTSGCTENNVPLPSGVLCLPEMLTQGDYVTAHYGKWHLGDEVFAQHSFDHWRSIEDGYEDYYSAGRDRAQRSSYHQFLIENGFVPQNGDTFSRAEAARLPEQYGKPAYLAREASRFIRENKATPFVLYVNFLEPHMPFFGPRDAQYDVSGVSLPANFDDVPTDAQPLKTRLLRHYYLKHGHSGLELRTEAHWRRMISNYWGLCSLVDTYVGRILDTLDDCGLRDDTIVVFTSDHGDMMGSHRLLAKCVMFEEAVRVPLLVRLPEQTSGKRVLGPVSQIDVVPTLLDLMGQPIPDHLQGKSQRAVFEQPGDSYCQDPVFIEWNGPNNGLGDAIGRVEFPDWMTELATHAEIEAAFCDPVRTVITPDGWKYSHSPRGEHELYNLREDPCETQNLALELEYNAVTARLTEEIRKWQRATGDSVTPASS